MSQSHRASWIEAVLNVGIGYLVALAVQLAVYPLYGIELTLGENLGIGLIFMAVSLVRGYVIRRIFCGWSKK